MTFVGMIVVMLRAGMYPFAKVYYTQAVVSIESEKQTPNPSAPPETPPFHKHNPSTEDKLSPPDAKFLAIWGGNTEASAMNPHCIDPNEEAPHPSAPPETPSFHKKILLDEEGILFLISLYKDWNSISSSNS